MSILTADHLTLLYGEVSIVDNFSIALPRGQITALVGPNGSGKSTILRALARLLQPTEGAVYLNGRNIAQMPTRTVAHQLTLLPQAPEIPAGITVRELIEYGRYPHRGLLGRLSTSDREAIEWALGMTGLESLAERSLDTLSGGERQRAWIALAIAQQTQVLLLDEPTTFLDIRHQLEVLALVRRLNQEREITVGWVLHDLNQAATYSDHLVMLKAGQVVTAGPPSQVMTPETIQAVFGIEVVIVNHPRYGLPVCLPCNLDDFSVKVN
ncbi:MAG: ABC transporter ATP-binding protein [Stenomitos frigidus ULC029]